MNYEEVIYGRENSIVSKMDRYKTTAALPKYPLWLKTPNKRNYNCVRLCAPQVSHGQVYLLASKR